MALDLLRDCTFFGPALPEPFVKFELEKHLRERQLLPRADGAEGRALQERWEVYRRKLRALGEQGGDLRVASHVLAPLTERLGYASFERQNEVGTREGLEDGGWLMSGEGSSLRCWSVELGTDLDAPNLRGRAYRFSPARVAQRVLLAQGERVGLLTDGEELRILICDPARPDSHIAIRLDQSNGWRAPSEAPDSYRLLLALASPSGTKAIPALTEAARLAQATVTRKLRVQARRAIEDFIQSVLDQPANAPVRATTDADELAKNLWREGLVLVYRLLFIFKLESSADPARAFSFAATSLWRNTYSPNVALASLVRKVLDDGAETGGLLEEGLRVLWRMFAHGLSSRELQVSALGGMLFGEGSTPLLDRLQWGETAVAKLLDALLWTPSEGRVERERVHYGALDVEDLGRVYEALLELEPGIATEPMCRLRRAKLEVVVPAAQGEAYRANLGEVTPDEEESDSDEEAEEEEESAPPRKRSNVGGKTKVQFIESVLPGRFYLRVGIGRKVSGSYYTPHPFVRFLVQETIGPQLAKRSPQDDPQPGSILDLKVLDPAMGSGHFLVESCRFIGDALYEACRLCDEQALNAENQADRASNSVDRERFLLRASELRQRVENLPDPNDELVAYLPSRVLEGQESGPSQRKAQALCRRLVAVHCLYGVDKNPLAVELAKLSLWLESYAEGLPLTFLNHRLIPGDSLAGPFSGHVLTYPRSGEDIHGLFVQGLRERLQETLASALAHVRELEISVGKDLADLERKQRAKESLDAALEPFRTLAAAWGGGVMVGAQASDPAYVDLLRAVADRRDLQETVDIHPALALMIKPGEAGLVYDLAFPEVFHPDGHLEITGGFDVVLGNPPWETIRRSADQFFGLIDFRALAGATRHEKKAVVDELLADPKIAQKYTTYRDNLEAHDRLIDRLYTSHKARVNGNLAGRGTYDAYMLFSERGAGLLKLRGDIGLVLPSAFHANEGATGVRRLFLEHLCLLYCFSFENRKKLFEIDSRFKFALVVARNSSEVGNFYCRFYLHEPDWLFGARTDCLSYSLEFVRRTGGEYLTLLELRNTREEDVAIKLFLSTRSFGEVAASHSIVLTQEANMTYDSHRFTNASDVPFKSLPDHSSGPVAVSEIIEQGFLPLYEGKTFHQYNDRWEPKPRYLVRISSISDKPIWKRAARYSRLAFRDIARSNDERTGIFCLLPPGVIVGNTAPVERSPEGRPHYRALVLLAVANSFSFDWALRQKNAAHVNLFILNACPFPVFTSAQERILAHSALRLTCNHEMYSALWRDQLGDRWRESSREFSWPALRAEHDRWKVVAAIDALVASAYGLSRVQYERVLSTFSHKSYLLAPGLCLATFDALEALGVESFTREYDPYWDIPLKEMFPEPDINLDEHGDGLVVDSGGQLLLSTQGISFKSSRSSAAASKLLDFRQEPDALYPPSRRDVYGLVSAHLKAQGELTSRDAQDLTGLDANAVRPYLERLVEEGLAVKEGQRRGTKYRKAEANA